MRGILGRFLKGATHKVLTGKEGPRGYYKGKRCPPSGFNTNKATHLVDRNRIHQFIVPDLSNFYLKPYVDSTSLPDDMKDEDFPRGQMNSRMFIELAKKNGNQYDVSKAEPYDWLVNPPPEVMKEIQSKKTYVPNPHHKSLPMKPHGRFKKQPNKPFKPFDLHN